MNLPKGKTTNKKKTGNINYNPSTIVSANFCSLEKTLGKYYLDLTPTLIDYSENRYGEFDEDGIPVVGYGENSFYFPVNIAQFGFIVHDLWLDNRNSEYLKRLENILSWFENKKKEYKDCNVWFNEIDNKKYGIKAPYISGMAIGEIISFYLRMYQIFKEPKLLGAAWKAYRFLDIPFEEGGVKRRDNEGNIWYEEFPTREPSFVLNGFIYTIFGLYDLYRVTGDAEVKNTINECITTLKQTLHLYDTGYWSLYDQLKKELVMVYYQRNVHVPQMEALFYLTGEPIFKTYHTKWKKNLSNLNILFVKIMYRVKPRLDRIKKRFN